MGTVVCGGEQGVIQEPQVKAEQWVANGLNGVASDVISLRAHPFEHDFSRQFGPQIRHSNQYWDATSTIAGLTVQYIDRTYSNSTGEVNM